MSDQQHHAILVVMNGSQPHTINQVADRAQYLGLVVIGPSAVVMNGYQTLCICPDGSRRGWPEATRSDAAREKFLEYLEELSKIEYIEFHAISFGDYGSFIDGRPVKPEEVPV